MMKKHTNIDSLVMVLAMAIVPNIAFGAGEAISGLIQWIGNMLNLLIPIMITLAVVIFFWGLALFLLKADEEKEKGRDIMLYGVLTLFVMVSIWGLVGILANTLGVGVGGTVNLPTVGR
jgi:hypothetical protein